MVPEAYSLPKCPYPLQILSLLYSLHFRHPRKSSCSEPPKIRRSSANALRDNSKPTIRSFFIIEIPRDRLENWSSRSPMSTVTFSQIQCLSLVKAIQTPGIDINFNKSNLPTSIQLTSIDYRLYKIGFSDNNSIIAVKNKQSKLASYLQSKSPPLMRIVMKS